LTRLLFVLWLMPVPSASAHDIAVEQPVEMVVQPQGARLVVRLNVPATLLAEAKLPRLQDGQLDAPAIDGVLSIVAADIARNLEVRQEDVPLAAPTTTVRVGADRMSIDVELVYAIRADAAGISARLNAFHAGQQPVRTNARYVPPSGPPQNVSVSGTPARVLFDPGAADVLQPFIARGLRALLNSGDHLLFLVCLLIPVRSARSAAGLVMTVALGQALAIATFAVRPWLTGDSLTALAMVAASAVVIAALQNIVSARVRWVVPIALAFGVLNGFAFAQSFAASAPLAGSHQWVALTVFLLVVDLGQFWLGAVVWATRLWLAGHGTPERVVAVLASVIIAHAALHRIVDRGHLLAQSGSFGAERAIVSLTLGWACVMLLVGLAEAVRGRAIGRRGRTPLGQAAQT